MRSAAAMLLFLLCMVVQAEDKERLELSGRLLLNADYFESVYSNEAGEESSDFFVRSGRLQLDYDFPQGWIGRLQLDLDDDQLELGSAYIRYHKWDVADVTIGKTKEPMGLERLTSASKRLTAATSMLTRNLTSGKNWGIHLRSEKKSRTWGLAITLEDDPDDDFEEDTPVAFSGRYTWAPLRNPGRLVHLGVAGSIRDWKGNAYQLRDRGETASADVVVRGAKFFADNQQTLAVEAMWQHGAYLLQAESMHTTLEDKSGADWDYSGFYITGSYLFSGAERTYRRGEFRRIRPGAEGAWEIVARHSYLDARDNGLGTKSEVTTLGINFYATRELKIMLNARYADLAGSVRHQETNGTAVTLRLQMLF